MPTNTTGKNKKYEELTRTLLDLVQTLQPGDPFPSQNELMRRYGVSDRTVLRSLDDLQRAGWIVRRHGKGTFVADPDQRASAPVPAPLTAPSGIVGVLILTIGPVYQHLLEQLTRQAEALGLTIICHHAHSETSFEDALPIEALNPRGFVLFSYYLLPIALRLREHGHRVILVGAPPAGILPEVSCVYNDQDHGGYEATKHLLDLGHRRLAYVAPQLRSPLEETQRWQGHQRALTEAKRAGITVEATAVALDVWMSWRTDPAQLKAFFARPNAPTGLLAWNDDIAAELLHLLYRAGVRVPEDVSVVGYDSLPSSQRSIPALTTVDSHVETQLRAVMQFLTQPATPPSTYSVMVTPTLVPRDSSRPPATFVSPLATASHPG